ncbi:ATP-binding protein [Pantoea vagans]|uniref:ATP-binding protein n=1 Tax=Pantoea vagans TaxID=470934 RepID=UPI0022521BF4|nr:ATP-binding protein [Pantoea vagans]MCX3308989.1 ATP-binding protein [Pantoea vagans]
MPPEEIMLPADYLSLNALALSLRQYLATFNLDEGWVYSFDLALCEAATNIIRHGYREQAGCRYRARFSHTASDVTVTLFDTGTAIPASQLSGAGVPEQEMTMDTLSESGRGMYLIQACVDQVRYLPGDNENQLSLIKRLPPGTR